MLTLGVGGAWAGNLAALAPYRPWFIGIALIALFFAARRIFRPATGSAPGEACAAPRARTLHKALFWVVAGMLLIALALPYAAPLFH